MSTLILLTVGNLQMQINFENSVVQKFFYSNNFIVIATSSFNNNTFTHAVFFGGKYSLSCTRLPNAQ